MKVYLVRRLLLAILVTFGVVTVVFFIVRVVPGDPAAVMLGPSATREEVAAVRHRLGLDRPLHVQYVSFLSDALRGDLGKSLHFNRPSTELVRERIPATVQLAVPSVVVSMVLALPLGTLAALRVNSIWDRAVSILTLVAQSFPAFWVGFMLILILSRNLKLLPTSGRGTWQHMVMPVITLSFPLTSFMARLVRSGLLDELQCDYVRTARGKGLAEVLVIRRHVFKNMLIPVVTLMGLQVGALLGGVVIAESVFAWPGVGRLLVDSILRKDFPVVQACVLFIAVSYVVVNLVVDVAYGWIDPRVRYE
jgi:peptide/nickel transport system permease protein